MNMKLTLIGVAAVTLVGCGAFTPVKQSNTIPWEVSPSYEYDAVDGGQEPILGEGRHKDISWEYEVTG